MARIIPPITPPPAAKDEGSVVVQSPASFNFVGDGVAVTDGGNGVATVTIVTPTTFTNPTLVGYTLTGVEVIVPSAMGALAVDLTKPENTKAVTGDVSFTYSSAAPTAGTTTRLTITADGTARTVTLPYNHWSVNRNGNITTVLVPASGTLVLVIRYNGTRWEIFGDPVAVVGTGSYELASNNHGMVFSIGDPNGSTVIATNAYSATAVVPWACSCAGMPWAIEAVGTNPACTIDIVRIADGTALPTASFIDAGTKPAITGTDNVESGVESNFTNKTFAVGDRVRMKVTTPGAAVAISFRLGLTKT